MARPVCMSTSNLPKRVAPGRPWSYGSLLWLLFCRNNGVVRDMKWTSSGEKICIAYDDGAVIVGSVDGNRLWGKELNMQLSVLEWSPDGRFILFSNVAGECHTYDSNGNAIAKVALYCNEGYVGEWARKKQLDSRKAQCGDVVMQP